MGLILATIALPVTDSRKEEQTSGSLFGNGQEEEQTQKERLQSQLEDILSQVEGVGQAKVLLTFEEEDSSAFIPGRMHRRWQGINCRPGGVRFHGREEDSAGSNGIISDRSP